MADPAPRPAGSARRCHLHASLGLQSSIDDPWAELPINTVIGGAYSTNSLVVHKLNLVEHLNAEEIVPYLLTARYDRTVFMETGRI